MNNRPKVYGFCDAGCKWRVPHYDEFASAAALIPIDVTYGNPFVDSDNMRTTFKFVGGEQNEWGFAIKVLMNTGDEIVLPLPAFDKYADGMRFRLLDVIIEEGYTDTEGTYHEMLNIVYECNGERYTHTIDSDAPWHGFNYCEIVGLMEAYIVNTDATFTVLAQDGEDGANVESLELIGQDENGGNIYRQTYSDGSTFDFVAPKGLTGEKGDGAQEVYDTLLDKKETDEYEDVQIATLSIDAFSLRKDSVWGDTALIEVEPSGTYVLSFDSCVQHSGSASLFLNEYTENNEQVVTDERLSFEVIGKSDSSFALVASIFPNGGRCTFTVGTTTKYIKLSFDAYHSSPERLPSGLTLTYKSPIFDYGYIKPDKIDAYTKKETDVKLDAIRSEIFSTANEAPELTATSKTGTFWIGSDGVPTDSESWYAFAYNRSDIVKIKSALLSVHFLETTTKLAFAFYNSETISADTFIGGHLFSEGTATSTENVYQFGELSIPDDCVTIVVCNRQASLTSPVVIFGKRTLSKETEANVRKVVNNEVERMASEEDATRTDFKYYGLPISLKQAKYKKVGSFSVIYDNGSEIGLNGAINGGAVYNNYFFLAGGGGLFAVYDLATKRYISKFYIAEHETIAPHANTVCFGNEFYSETDEFPLLYVNAYQEDLPRGTCYALRIQRNGTTFTANIVQTITIGFTATELWLCSGEVKVYGNFAIDTDNGYLYAYMPRTPEHTYRFFRFNLPTLSEGENVTLQDDDIIKYFDVSQMIPTLDGISYPQDGIYHQGKIYMLDCTASTIGRRCIWVVNTSSEQTESVIDMISLGYTSEVEFIAVYNGCMVLGTLSADIIDFD